MTEDAREIDPGTVLLVALAELQGLPIDAWTEGPFFDRAVRLERLRVLMGRAKEWVAALELSLMESMEEDDVVVPGVGALHRREQWSSSWRYSHSGNQMREDLKKAVANDIATDVATGDIDPMKRNVALATLDAAYEAIPMFSSLKVAGKRRFKIDVDDYRQESMRYVLELEVPNSD